MLISLVGLSGSGKTHISNILTSYNSKIIHLDIDKIGHSIYNNQEVINNLLKEFGPSVITKNKVNRKELGNIVFTSPESMKVLEQITWSEMEKQIDTFIQNNLNKIIILDWLLIPKTKYFFQSDLRILVTAPYETRMNRAIKRDGITEVDFKKRDNAAPTINKEDFNYIIENIDLQKTEEEVKLIYDKSIIHR